ncbi:CbiX/SirB N-terminal domain-containing protein [soil metagenome]
MKALLLIAHGSRRAEANADLDWLADAIRHRQRFDLVKTCYLELAEPTIAAGGEACVTAGATTVAMLPYFLSPGVHVREDLIAARDELAAKFPAVTFTLAEPLGRHPLLVEIVLERCGSR